MFPVPSSFSSNHRISLLADGFPFWDSSLVAPKLDVETILWSGLASAAVDRATLVLDSPIDLDLFHVYWGDF